MNADRFTHSERVIIEEIGAAQKKLRVIRQDDLERGRDWEHIAGEVRYSDDGRARLLSLLQVEPSPPAEKISDEPPADPAPAPGPAVSTAAAPVVPASRPAGDHGVVAMLSHTVDQLLQGVQEDLTCVRCFKPNKRMLEAKRANGAIVLVRVKDNTNLRPGMTMRCRFGAGRTWELNQRLPRHPGKW